MSKDGMKYETPEFKITNKGKGSKMKLPKSTNINDMSTLSIIVHLVIKHKFVLVTAYAIAITIMHIVQGSSVVFLK